MVRANISQLKSKLSAYVAQARAGETVLILDRATPVARLCPVEGGQTLVVREAKGPPSPELAKLRIPLLKSVNILALLRQDRDAR